VTPLGQLLVEIVEHEVAQEWREHSLTQKVTVPSGMWLELTMA
jgi:hypothetical protein